MPQIVEYEAKEGLGIRPTEIGIEATAAAARRVGSEYSEISQVKKEAGARLGSAITAAGREVVDYMEHQQISQGSAAYAGLLNAKTKEWTDRNNKANPNDPTVQATFMEGLEGDLQKFKQGFLTEGGQDWAERRVEAMRQHFYTKTSGDRARAAGEAVAVNAGQTISGLSNAAYHDGTEPRFALDSVEATIGAQVDRSGIVDKLSAKTKLTEKAREEIVKGAVFGYIDKTGEIPPWIDKYSKYIDYKEVRAFDRAARQEKRINEMATRAQQQEVDHKAKADFNQQLVDIRAETLPKDVNSAPVVTQATLDKYRKLRDHPGARLEQGAYNAMGNHLETIISAMNKPEPLPAVSQKTLMDILPDIRSGRITDPSEIDAKFRPTPDHPTGLLTAAHYNYAMKEFFERKTEAGVALSRDRGDFWKRWERTIDPSIPEQGYRSALGDQAMHRAEIDARKQEEAARAAGDDPHLVYTPGSKWFFGARENISKYAVTLQEVQRYEAAQRKPLTEGSVPPAAPRPAAAAPAAARPALKPGDTYRGNRYKGGPLDDPNSWERASQ